MDNQEQTLSLRGKPRSNLNRLLSTLETDYKDTDSLSSEELETIKYAIKQNYLAPHYDFNGNIFINPNGVVRREEVFFALETGNSKGDSIDGVSKEHDYFNKGYNSFVSSTEDNFYNVYRRSDLDNPVTRVELAYLLANHDEYAFAEDYDLEEDITKLYDYQDISNLEIETKGFNNLFDLFPKGSTSMEEYLADIKQGNRLLTVPLIVLTHHLDQLINHVYKLDGLYPLKTVSRLELAYILKELDSLK